MPPSNVSASYAGDISPAEAWDELQKSPSAQLIDVRTAAEWSFVGVPDLSSLKRQTLLVEWQSFPSMTVNTDFAAQISTALAAAGADRDTPIFFLCRSGGRSRAAAIAATQAGYAHAYNVAGGFEGDLDAERHRGQRNGWKASGLPWRQS